MSTVTLHEGDNIKGMRSLPEASVHSIVTDPPYLLTSIVKRFGKEGSAPARRERNDGSFARLSGGFMNKQWDSPTVELPPLSAEFGHYMAGLIDGEGCFSVHKKLVNGYEAYDCQFSITLRSDDSDILVEMQKQLGGIGSLVSRPGSDNKNAQARYCISSKADCQMLRAALTVFPLRAKKARDFDIWCHALDAWVNHEPKSSWEDVSFYRDQLMLVKRFGSLYKPELLFHYRWAREAFRVLKPGGYMFAFSGSRTGHWQACAMELAGFIMHPMHGWCFGSGFPKAHAADKAIDKALGVQGGFVAEGDPVKRMIPGADQHRNTSWIKDNGREYQPGQYVPGSPEAAEWEGWAYGTQAQKPALEPIYLGQKPFDAKTGATNLLKHGVGAVNIDGCRVGDFVNTTPGGMDRVNKSNAEVHGYRPNTYEKGREVTSGKMGRHPANLLLDGSPEVTAMFPANAGASAPVRGTEPSGVTKEIYGKFNGRVPGSFFADSGSAARFFHQFPLDTQPLIYNGKAAKADRGGSNHPTVKPIALLRYLIRHITPPGGTVLDMFAGSGTTAEAARLEGFNCILMEAEPEYVEFLRKRFGIAGENMFEDLLGSSTGGGPLNDFEDLLG